MSAKAIREATGKGFLNRCLQGSSAVSCRFATVTADTNWAQLVQDNPWLTTEKLVVKPDQLIKRRGKLGLIKVNTDLEGVKAWLGERMDKDQKIGNAVGKLKTFIIEPFVAHQQDEEFYVCIYSSREGDTILFHHEGGVDIGDVDAKAEKLEVGIDEKPSAAAIQSLVSKAPADKHKILTDFITQLYGAYVDLFFTYLEINPLVMTGKNIYVLDLAAKIDQCAEYLCKAKWGEVEFPPPFGREAYPEEAYIADLDAKSGASLKLTILNGQGRIWTMVAGGGASVIYADTICDMGGTAELANYGEYSGAPSEGQTYEYAKTILGLMTKENHPEGKVLIIGGGIANFTNVAATFKGIVRALRDYQQKLIDGKVSIFVRRAGPNFQEGLRIMRELGETLGVPIHVFGPETHMTAIVGMALKKRSIPTQPRAKNTTANFLLPGGQASATSSPAGNRKSADRVSGSYPSNGPVVSPEHLRVPLFSKNTRAIVWGMQSRAVQGMLDFDYTCSRSEPSVVAMVYPMVGDHKQKFYWGHKEILVPVYKNMSDAMAKHPKADVIVSFASLRSAYESTVEAMSYPQIRVIAIIAEGIPENLTRKLNKIAKKKKVPTATLR